VAIGGGIGSLMRFAIAQWVSSIPVWTPLSILIINVTGCFVISFLNFVLDPSGDIYLGPRSRLFLLVGVCGGYTTFSSFSLISFNAARHGALADLFLNIGLSHVLCLLSVWAGSIIAAPFPRAFRAMLPPLTRGELSALIENAVGQGNIQADAREHAAYLHQLSKGVRRILEELLIELAARKYRIDSSFGRHLLELDRRIHEIADVSAELRQ
jgi:fluoride exporter